MGENQKNTENKISRIIKENMFFAIIGIDAITFFLLYLFNRWGFLSVSILDRGACDSLMAASISVMFISLSMISLLTDKTEKLLWENISTHLMRSNPGFLKLCWFGMGTLIAQFAAYLAIIHLNNSYVFNAFFFLSFIDGIISIILLFITSTEAFYKREKILKNYINAFCGMKSIDKEEKYILVATNLFFDFEENDVDRIKENLKFLIEYAPNEEWYGENNEDNCKTKGIEQIRNLSYIALEKSRRQNPELFDYVLDVNLKNDGMLDSYRFDFVLKFLERNKEVELSREVNAILISKTKEIFDALSKDLSNANLCPYFYNDMPEVSEDKCKNCIEDKNKKHNNEIYSNYKNAYEIFVNMFRILYEYFLERKCIESLRELCEFFFSDDKAFFTFIDRKHEENFYGETGYGYQPYNRLCEMLKIILDNSIIDEYSQYDYNPLKEFFIHIFKMCDPDNYEMPNAKEEISVFKTEICHYFDKDKELEIRDNVIKELEDVLEKYRYCAPDESDDWEDEKTKHNNAQYFNAKDVFDAIINSFNNPKEK